MTGTTNPAEAATPADTAGTVSTATGTDDGAPQAVVATDQTLTLERGAAIDVDSAGNPAARNHADGATGDYDLYHDWGQYKSDTIQATNGPNTYSYPGGNPNTAYVTCKDVIATATPYMTANLDFCFRTSAGRIAHAVVTRERTDHAFVLHVIVWNDPA